MTELYSEPYWNNALRNSPEALDITNIPIEYCVRFINEDFPAVQKARLYNNVNNWTFNVYLGCYVTEFFFRYTHSQISSKTFYLYLSENEKKFIQHTRCIYRQSRVSRDVMEAIKKNSVSAFEISRMMAGKRISLSTIYAAISKNAENIMHMLLERYSNEIFKLRTPTEWLFTICQFFKTDTAINTIKQIEKKFPGIVKNAKDPWGCNLLWHTFYHDSWRYQGDFSEDLQKELINCGCDPNEKNPLGLSFNLVLKNRE